jgi:hypothetical protein
MFFLCIFTWSFFTNVIRFYNHAKVIAHILLASLVVQKMNNVLTKAQRCPIEIMGMNKSIMSSKDSLLLAIVFSSAF